ncbi:MAG: N-acetylmuramoyl-L-alanine amidase [Lachnospiraceae bacterium]|jgi:N-acetylmuramoyl-L-alanine amidase|nr:N-acetylmuramoyl-L-alanine amidase [Lachnospiraceae bacterium]
MRRRFLFVFLCLFCLFFAAGCSSPKYQAVDLGSLETTAEGEAEAEKLNERALAAVGAAVKPSGTELETLAGAGGLEESETSQASAEPEGQSEAGLPGTDTETPAPEEPLAASASDEVLTNGYIVAVDAGRQAKANTEKEPIGPSSETMKAKMSEGSTGTATGVPEYELTLAVAKKLEAELKARGYEVVMIRSSNDVNLSNAERAEIANESGAAIFIRLQANVMENSGVYGALTMCMTAQNPYNAGLHDKSYTLSKKIVDSICAQTGTKNRGVQEVDNSGAINWSQIPVSVVRLGFLSNPDEDRWMQNEDYQGKIVNGIADAVDSYFGEGN